MKVKQSDDLSQIKILNLEIEKFEEIYIFIINLIIFFGKDLYNF